MNTEENLSDDEFAEAMRKVCAWVQADGWKLEKIPAKRAVLLRDQRGTTIGLQRPFDRPETLIIRTSFSPTEEMQAYIAEWPEKAKFLLWDIRFQLLSLGVSFLGIEPATNRIDILAKFYLDDLRRNEFARVLAAVQNSNLAVLWIFQKHMGEPGPSQASNGPDWLM